jgi:hypothetical protein
MHPNAVVYGATGTVAAAALELVHVSASGVHALALQLWFSLAVRSVLLSLLDHDSSRSRDRTCFDAPDISRCQAGSIIPVPACERTTVPEASPFRHVRRCPVCCRLEGQGDNSHWLLAICPLVTRAILATRIRVLREVP